MTALATLEELIGAEAVAIVIDGAAGSNAVVAALVKAGLLRYEANWCEEFETMHSEWCGQAHVTQPVYRAPFQAENLYDLD